MSLNSNILDVAFTTTKNIDKVIGTYEDSFSLDAPAAGATNTVTWPETTNIADTTLFQGIFSLDGGSTWNNLQARVPHPDRTQGEVFVYGESTSGTFNIVGQNQRNLSSTVANNYTVMYRVALIAKKDQGEITPQPIGANIIFDSRNNYQKIAVDDVTPTSGTNQTVTVAHNLGYIPKVRAFREVSGSLRSMGFSLSKRVTIDTNSVYVFVPGTVTGNIHTRIYYDS